MFQYFIYALALSSSFAAARIGPSDVKQYLSDVSGNRLKEIHPLDWKIDGASKDDSNTIELNPSETMQRFDGMGGSFMRAGSTVFNKMPENVQGQILADLFDQKDGASFVLGKIPIGATDFGVPTWYTYADEQQSEDLPDFNMDHDTLESQDGFVPYVRRAQEAAGRPLRLQATLDYPPDWMLNTSTPLPFADINSTYIPALANYYYKYYKEIANQGLRLDYVALVNEVTDSYVNISYPNMRTLLVDYVAPMFRAAEHAPQLTWSAKFSRRVTQEASPAFYEMDGVQDSTDVIFYHGYDCNYGPAEDIGWECTGSAGLNTTCPYLEDAAREMRTFYEQYGRNRTIWMTELCYASEFGDYNVSHGCPVIPRLDFDDAMQWGDMIFADLNIVGANGWIYWNLILDTTGGPWLDSAEHNDPNPNEQQPVIVADPESGEYYLTGVYFAMNHFSRYIAVDSVRIGASANGVYPTIQFTAYTNADRNQITIVCMNDDPDTHSFTLKYKHLSTEVTMPAISFLTLVFDI